MRGRARSIRASWFCGPRAATRTSRTTRVSVSGTRHAVARGACGTSSDARAGERDRVRPAAMVLASRRARARTGDWLPGRMDAAGGASEAGGERGLRRRRAHLTKTTRDGTTDDSDALFLMGTFLIYRATHGRVAWVKRITPTPGPRTPTYTLSRTTPFARHGTRHAPGTQLRLRRTRREEHGGDGSSRMPAAAGCGGGRGGAPG